MISLLSLATLLLCTSSVYSSDWKDVFKPKPLHDLSNQCLNDTTTWIESLAIFATVSEGCLAKQNCSTKELKILENNLYAIQELDAFGKFPVPGMLEAATLYDGSYQECNRVSGKKYDTNYCYLVLTPGKNASCSSTSGGLLSMLPIRIAVCLPESCDHQDMVNIFNQLSPYPFTACSAYCAKFEVEKDTPFWGFTIFMIVMVVIALAATTLDYIRDTVYGLKSDKERNLLFKILLSFSFWTNAELLLSVKEQKPGFIKSLDCIRLFSMCWVVTGHSFIYLIFSDTFMPVIDFPKHFWNHLLLNAFVSVDTFFVLSGIVVTYLFFKTKPKKRMVANPVTWIMFYVHRYLRLTPPIMLFIGFFTVYAPYIQGSFSASQMNQLAAQAESCKTNWWQNLIYINNFPQGMTCYAPTWYLAADTQLYLVAPIVLIGLYFSFAAGTGLIVAGCVGSIITTYIVFGIYSLSADMFGNGDVQDFFTIAYNKPWIRCPPYLVGMLTGYLLGVYGNRKIRLNWAVCVAAWLVAFVIAAFCLFATYDYDKGSHWSVFTRATFYNFHRLGWGIFICWVVAANHMGWGGPISNFMSHPMWQPFGRLSYCAYIVHWVVLFYFLNVGGHPIHYYSAWEVFTYTSIPATLLSYIFAFFWSCFFEIPTLKLEKMLIEAILGTGRTSAKLEPVGETGKVTPILEKKVEENSWIEEIKEDENTKV
ncbi:hypothetical protein L5515_016714 [Caenorhabditis briggsae]|uniref:Nose resistant-to-fluoxetine protein N-terminal domain-containing protein n=2 Tax=Caenorhabditis briggsae TaxID=6238 RepID=A0AAE9JPV4_CAEBR|nr:hypothetical protein L5515_016714 [Caenorhabditis briggsae]